MQNRMLINNEFYDVSQTVLQLNFQKTKLSQETAYGLTGMPTIMLSDSCPMFVKYHMSPLKRICVFDHSVMTNFNCACPAIQRGQGSGFLSEGSS